MKKSVFAIIIVLTLLLSGCNVAKVKVLRKNGNIINLPYRLAEKYYTNHGHIVSEDITEPFEIPIEVVHYSNAIRAYITINICGEDRRFILDTGSGNILLFKDSFVSLKNEFEIEEADSRGYSPLIINKLEINGREITNVYADVLADRSKSFGSAWSEQFDGLVGWMFLARISNGRFQINFPQQKIVLSPQVPTKRPQELIYTYQLFSEISLNGEPAKAFFDTGGYGSFINNSSNIIDETQCQNHYSNIAGYGGAISQAVPYCNVLIEANGVSVDLEADVYNEEVFGTLFPASDIHEYDILLDPYFFDKVVVTFDPKNALYWIEKPE